jgi:hypothetical protein
MKEAEEEIKSKNEKAVRKPLFYFISRLAFFRKQSRHKSGFLVLTRV